MVNGDRHRDLPAGIERIQAAAAIGPGGPPSQIHGHGIQFPCAVIREEDRPVDRVDEQGTARGSHPQGRAGRGGAILFLHASADGIRVLVALGAHGPRGDQQQQRERMDRGPPSAPPRGTTITVRLTRRGFFLPARTCPVRSFHGDATPLPDRFRMRREAVGG
ncbi:hypothetical protein TVNIR_1117 [Thioalkalivibrio nitratireducens DSM 14787]|uniref:Uncharacterized protein n=1 Tax=Thioalkalivibrio nitratireducens (strain DSM 14787 / UNIQEM 213 / ALEN2) TaxID=1255043 RepID=L0DWP6_THIND|nr:hypothetical protein TVNIR_1117 [Thioalkalivibrio nitratireducens DSM 14787]